MSICEFMRDQRGGGARAGAPAEDRSPYHSQKSSSSTWLGAMIGEVRPSPQSRSIVSREPLALLGRRRPRIVVGAEPLRERADENKRARTLGIRRGEDETSAASECPSSAARSEPTASRTARTSSIRCSSVGSLSFGTRSESPVPRLSKRIRRENEPAARGSRRIRLLPASGRCSRPSPGRRRGRTVRHRPPDRRR